MAERDEVDTVSDRDDCEDKMVKKSPFKNSNGATDYLTLEAKLAFTKLRKAFIEAPILQQLDPECHIWRETDTSGYAIGKVLSQLTLDNLDQ